MDVIILDASALPYGTEFWDVAGIPVAFIPTEHGDTVAVAFDNAAPRHFSMLTADRDGKLISRDDFAVLVAGCRARIQPEPI